MGDVKCPTIDVPLKKGLTFLCTVEIDGVPCDSRCVRPTPRVNVHIDQNQALIITKKLEAFVAGYANQHGRPTRDGLVQHGQRDHRDPGPEAPVHDHVRQRHHRDRAGSA